MIETSNIRWCSDALEFACWNGEVVHMAFIIDAFDPLISGSELRDLRLEAVEKRFGITRASKPVAHLSEDGGP